jgi:hypothetical protein
MPEQLPTPWKMPPLIKVYEALGAVADDHVQLIDERQALVSSSDGRKTYEVELVDRTISANDNASYWQGYLGYPAIAVLIARGVVPADPAAMAALRGIPWKELNSRFHNDYARTLDEVVQRLAERATDTAIIDAACTAVLQAVQKFAPTRGPRRRSPRSRTASVQ